MERLLSSRLNLPELSLMSFNHAIRTLAVLAILFVASPITPAQINPMQNSPDLDRGIELYRQGKYAEASNLLKKGSQANEDGRASLVLFLAWRLIRQKELKDATKALETALKLRPNFASSHAALGYALLLRNRVAVALHEALAAQKIDPSLVDAHYISGVAYLRLGKRELALKEADSVLGLDPKFANAYLLKSQALVSFVDGVLIREEPVEPFNDRYPQARDALEKFLQLSASTEDKETWTTQLESLRYFATPRKGPDKIVYSGKEVTAKARIL